MAPQDRWALGLGLLVIVGLLYVSCSFVVKQIEGSGVSPFLLTYLSTCLFVLHLPFYALLRTCQGCYEKHSRELLVDCEARSQQKQELGGGEGDVTRQLLYIEIARQGGEQKGTDLRIKKETQGRRRDQESKSFGEALQVAALDTEGELLLEPERSADELGSQGASGPQTPADSILDAWMAPEARVKLAALEKKENLQEAGASQPLSTLLKEAIMENCWKDSNVGQETSEPGHISSSKEATEGLEPGLGQSQLELKVLDSHCMKAGKQDGFSSAAKESASSRYSGSLPSLLCAEHVDAVRVALVVGPLWFVAQYAYTLSLTLTSVTSNTILFTSTSLFTFLISVFWLKERFTLLKLAAILCAMIGTALVSISDAQSAPEGNAASSTTAVAATLGNLVTLASALVYAFYGTSVKYMLPEEEHFREELFREEAAPKLSVSTSLVFGYIGLLGGVLLLPWLLVLRMAGTEGVGWMGARPFGLILVKGIVGNVVADYLCSRAISLTTPTLASVGMAFQAPIAILADFVIYGVYPKALMLLGALLVVGGFFGIDLNMTGQKPRA